MTRRLAISPLRRIRRDFSARQPVGKIAPH
jgi:hypothetical protein